MKKEEIMQDPVWMEIISRLLELWEDSNILLGRMVGSKVTYQNKEKRYECEQD